MLRSIITIEKSILENYFQEYKLPWEIIRDLKDIINKIDKSHYKEIIPNVWIGKDVKIDKFANIIGPCIIDDFTEIKNNAYIRENVIIGKKCTIGNSTEIKNSILLDESTVPHFNYVGDSILGYKSHLGAGVILSNLKSNKTNVKITLNKNTYDTNLRKFGSIIGDNCEIGCNSVLNPGTVLGKNVIIYPLTMVKGEIEANKIVKNDNKIVERNDVI